MLSIATMSRGQGNYYADLAREDYYLEGGEPPGVWFGTGKELLGLPDKIEREEFLELFDGFLRGEPLSQSAGQPDRPGWSRRPGWDLTFSAPKSVSAAASQASPETAMEIRAAHLSAVEKALQYVEDNAAWTRRGKGGKELERCKALFATFEHGTSRAQDPQLHTHALLLNIGIREDGTTGTLETKFLYDLKMAAGAIYRAELAYQLERRLGLIAVRERSWFEIQGVSQALCDEFSKRRAEIEKVLRDKGLSGARASEIAALSTRHVKEHVARGELLHSWQEIGQAFGWSTKEIEALCTGPKPERSTGKQLEQLASKTLTTLTQKVSYFTERELVRAMAEGAQTLACGADAVIREARQFLENSAEIVRLGLRFKEPIYTTKEMLQIETELMAQAKDSANAAPLSVSNECLDDVLSSRPTIKAEQAEALRHVTQGSGAIALITGMAGTGKTFTLDAVREALEASGYRVLGAALAGKAARGLEEGAQIQSSTIARLLGRLDRGAVVLDSRTVLVIDEAGMVGTRHMKRLVDPCTQAGSKLVLVGDEKQLQPIDAGGPFAAFSRELGSATLSDIQRQKDEWARQAVKDFAFGNTAQALSAYAERGLVSVSKDSEAAKAAVLQAWEQLGGVSNPKDNTVLAGTHREVVGLNREIQDRRLKHGFLKEASVSVDGEKFHPGDRVLFTENSRAIGVDNGTLGTVLSVNRLTSSITVGIDSNDDSVGLEKKTVNTKVYPHLKLGYAMTTHKAQGMTGQNLFILTSESMQDLHLSYVQASRARGETRFFTTEAEAGDGLSDLARRMEKSHQKEMAIDAIRENEKEMPSAENAGQQKESSAEERMVEVGIIRQGENPDSSAEEPKPPSASSPWISVSHYKPFEEGWGRYRDFQIPYFAFSFLNKILKPDETVWEKSGYPGDLELKLFRPFQTAPDWNPFKEWKIPYLKFTPNPDPLGIVKALTHTSPDDDEQIIDGLNQILSNLHEERRRREEGGPNLNKEQEAKRTRKSEEREEEQRPERGKEAGQRLNEEQERIKHMEEEGEKLDQEFEDEAREKRREEKELIKHMEEEGQKLDEEFDEERRQQELEEKKYIEVMEEEGRKLDEEFDQDREEEERRRRQERDRSQSHSM